MKCFKEAVKKFLQNIIINVILVVIFSVPLIATIGQYVSSGFMNSIENFPIIAWPGIKGYICLSMMVWIMMGIMAAAYVFAIVYLLRKKTFGIVVIIGFVGGRFIANKLGDVVNYFMGWIALEGMSAPNSINRSLLSMWTNPLYEEIIFRGIPLIVLMLLKNKVSAKVYKYAVILYIIVPSIMFVAYHVPIHGPARIVDTFILGCVFSYLALKYSFFAPLVLHYMFDSSSVIYLTNNSSLPKDQIVWLTQNTVLLNSIFYNSIFYLKVAIPIIIIWNIINIKKLKNDFHNLNL